jgi:hypothetical protein
MTALWSLRIVSACLTIPPALRLVPLDRLAHRLGRPRTLKRPSAEQQEAIMRRVDALLGRLPPPWRRTCLTRTAVLYHLLRRSGMPVELCLGVRASNGKVEAHAWMEREGVPYMEGEGMKDYEELARFGADEAVGAVKAVKN